MRRRIVRVNDRMQENSRYELIEPLVFETENIRFLSEEACSDRLAPGGYIRTEPPRRRPFQLQHVAATRPDLCVGQAARRYRHHPQRA